MAARSIYLTVAALLRAQHPPIDAYAYPHSPLAARLRQDYIERDILLNARLSRMVAMGALYAHPSSDPDKGLELVKQLYESALSTVPYMGTWFNGGNGASGSDQERDAAVAEYLKLKAEGKMKREE